jgi:hypothetical protein
MRMRILALAVIAAAVGAPAAARAQFPAPLGAPAPVTADSEHVLQLSFDPDGRVSLSAKGVTIRDILAEWARQCGCYVVNGDKMTGGPLEVPLLFEHQPQEAVLESLLRPAAGFVLTPARAGVTSKSDFETIYIVATSAASASSYLPPPTTSPFGVSTPGGPDDEIAPVTPIAPGAALAQPPAASAPPTPTSSAPLPPGMAPASYPTTSTPTPPPPGTPGTFVPIVPVTAGPPQPQATAPGTVAPGSSQTPPPIPLPQPGR